MHDETKAPRVDLSRAVWRKSSASGPHCDNCVEVAFVDDAVAVRNSKRPDGPVVTFTRPEWDAFITGAKDGEFDLPELRHQTGEPTNHGS